MARTQKGMIIRDSVRRFQHLPSRTIARHILNTHGPLFDNDIEKIRSQIRYYRGKNGADARKNASGELFQDTPKMPKTWAKKRTNYKLTPGLWGVIQDLHIPFHQETPLEAAFQEFHSEKIDGLFLNGDMQDLASIGFWRTAKRDFNREIELFIDFLDITRHEFPKTPIVYKPGNHELRLPDYFVTHAPELALSPLASMETVLGFEERGIEFLGYYQKVMAGKLPILHGHEVKGVSKAVNAARGLFLRAKTFCAAGHFHSSSMHPAKDLHGDLLTTWSFGCCCDLEPDWNPYGNDWNWGYALVNVEKNGDFEVVNRRVLNNGSVV